MRTAFRRNAETPQTSHVTALVWELRSPLRKALAAFPARGCWSSRDVLAQELEAIYSSCVGKQRPCKSFFLDKWEIWSLLGLWGRKALAFIFFRRSNTVLPLLVFKVGSVYVMKTFISDKPNKRNKRISLSCRLLPGTPTRPINGWFLLLKDIQPIFLVARSRPWLPKVQRCFQRLMHSTDGRQGETCEENFRQAAAVSVRLLGQVQPACVIFPLELQSD